MNWIVENVEFIIQPPEAKIFIIAKSNDWNYGDICIDDIFVYGGKCQEKREFDNDYGGRMIRYSSFIKNKKMALANWLENPLRGKLFFIFIIPGYFEIFFAENTKFISKKKFALMSKSDISALPFPANALMI